MKPCAQNKKLIVWLVMDALDAPQAAQLQAHLRQCEGCRAYQAEIASVSQRIGRLPAALEAEDEGIAAREVAPKSSGASRTTHFPTRNSRRVSFNWGLALPALAVVALALVILSVLLKNPLPTSRFVATNQPRFKVSAPTSLLPTLGHYQAVANESLDELDDLLLRQSQRPVPSPPAPSANTFALLQLPD
ncbi:MAG TPA: zf-HC2 domain-containing protein [Verrucomicrobiae bacterium]|nr:zf-HC2 domain-containing protein [Verrucomicrobiae bacterium]